MPVARANKAFLRVSIISLRFLKSASLRITRAPDNKGLSECRYDRFQRPDYGGALPTFNVSSFFDEWPSETTPSPGTVERIERERWSNDPVDVSPVSSLSLLPILLAVRRVVYFIALLALLHQPPRHTLAAVTVERCSRPRPPATPSEPSAIPRGLNIDCDSDL